jgi:hypothetical protein
MLDDIALDDLSAAQHLFAREHTAVPVMRSDVDHRSVFMYRSDEHRTHRWLVDERGRTVDSASFRR